MYLNTLKKIKNSVLYVASFLIFPDNADQNATLRKTTQKRHEITHHFWKKFLPSLEGNMDPDWKGYFQNKLREIYKLKRDH